MLQHQKEFNGKQDTTIDMLRSVLRNQTLQEKEKGKQGVMKSKTDPADRKRHTLKEVTDHFKAQFPAWDTMMKEMKAQRADIQSEKHPEMNVKHGNGTGTWLLADQHFQAWKAGEAGQLLWIRGPAGIGKTFIAETVVTNLEQSLKERQSSAYFFFREEQEGLTSWDNAIFSLSAQVAEKDSNYCEHLALDLAKDEQDSGRWARCFATRFGKAADASVYLVLDGIDEMKIPDRMKLCSDLQEAVGANCRICFLLVSRPDLPEIEALNPSIIDLTKEKLGTDMQHVIVAACRSLPRLKKFRRTAKIAILRKLKAQADGKHHLLQYRCGL
jgi:hypothetical protein